MQSAYELAAAVAWAMEEAAFKQLLTIAERENPSIEALEAEWGQKLDSTRTVTIRDGIATVPVIGPIFARANLFTRVSGATSFEILAQDLTAAIKSPEVKAVVLKINSPGGTVDGTNETAQLIRDLSTRMDKPIVAYGSHVLASAAYWIASAANWIVAEETTEVGSIGVVMTIVDKRARAAAQGLREHRIVSSQSPMKDVDLATDDGRSVVQGRVDKLAHEFIRAVAGNRDVPIETVMTQFGRGNVMIADDAKSAGMIDAVGNYEDLLRALSGRMPAGGPRRLLPAKLGPRRRTSAMTDKITAASIAAEHPEVATALRAEGDKAGYERGKTDGAKEVEAKGIEAGKKLGIDEGRKLGADAEFERLAAIDAAAVKGFEQLATECKADRKSTAADYAVKVLAAQKQQQSGELDKLKTDEKARAGLPAAGQTQDGGKGEPEFTAADMAKRIDAKMRAAAKDGLVISPAEAAAEVRKELQAA